jgi:hypothetical protein
MRNKTDGNCRKKNLNPSKAGKHFKGYKGKHSKLHLNTIKLCRVLFLFKPCFFSFYKARLKYLSCRIKSFQRLYILSEFNPVLECNFIWSSETLRTVLHYTLPPAAGLFFSSAFHLHTLKEPSLLSRIRKLISPFLVNLSKVNLYLKAGVI